MQIPKKHFNVVHSIFIEHDTDGNGLIDREEFGAAVRRLEERDDSTWRKLKGAAGDSGSLAAAMYESAARKNKKRDGITLSQFVGLFFPYLPQAEVERACHHYTYKPPPPPKPEKTLDDVEGAREEIDAIFHSLDKENDGFVKVSALQPMMQRIGISEQEAQNWISNLPSNGPWYKRVPGLQRKKSKLDQKDIEDLLAPTYIEAAESPQAKTKEQLQRELDWNSELYTEMLGGAKNPLF